MLLQEIALSPTNWIRDRVTALLSPLSTLASQTQKNPSLSIRDKCTREGTGGGRAISLPLFPYFCVEQAGPRLLPASTVYVL